MCLKEVFSHFWLMEQIFIQNRQNMREIFQKLSANSKVFLVTLLPRYIAFPPMVVVVGGGGGVKSFSCQTQLRLW